MAKGDYRKGDLAALGGFLALPFIVLDSTAYLSLDSAAQKLVLDVYRQYTGKNNGRMSPAFELMKARGWKNETTLSNAKKKVRASRLITVTKVGTRKKGNCELWAVNWLKLDWSPNMEIKPAGHDYMGFLELKDAKIDPIPERHSKPPLSLVA
ncbi:hypothetical protein [Eoetvoesiella caeni]